MLFFHWDTARRAENYRAVLKNTATGADVAERLVAETEVVSPARPPL